MKLNSEENKSISHGFFQKRLNRFLAEVDLNGESVLAHVPNPGRMLELLIPSKKVYLREKSEPHRKTDYDLIGVEHNQSVISIDSNLPNRFILKLLRNHQLKMFSEYEKIIPEPRIYDGRFDFKLIGKSGNQLVEVKSCTLVVSRRALFPENPFLTLSVSEPQL
jgi:sugar fermentation stimulation protein A